MNLFFIVISLILATLSLYIIQYKQSKSTKKITTPDEALFQLLQGNKKYSSPWRLLARKSREKVSTIQHPFAVILSCSDSRVPTEIIFNQLGVGSLFVVRNAGNVADGVVLGSIEYGIEQLKALLIIVLGHERCGAVTATVDTILEQKAPNIMYPGHIQDIIDAISPAVHIVLQDKFEEKTMNNALKQRIIADAIKENIHLVIGNLYSKSEIISKALDSNQVKIVGAYYDLNDGNVKIIT